MTSAINNRTDQFHSVATATQNMSTSAPSSAKPYRFEDLIPRNWEGSVEKGEFRNYRTTLASVDASVVRPRRQDAGARRKRRQDRQRQLVRGLFCGGVPRRRDSPVPTSPQNNESPTIEHGAASANGVRSVASDCSELRPEEQIRQHICEKAATSATGIVQRRLSTLTAS